MGHGRPSGAFAQRLAAYRRVPGGRFYELSERWHRRAVLALVLVAIMVAPFGPARSGCRRARGDSCWRGTWDFCCWRATGDARSRGADLARARQQRQPRRRELELQHLLPRPPAGAPRGHHRLHPGAESPGVPHGPRPDRGHDAAGVVQRLLRRVHSIRPDPPRRLAKPVLRHRGRPARAGAPARTRACSTPTTLEDPDWNLGSTPASSSTRRRAAARATRRSRSRWIPALLPGPYYVTSDVDGPTMSGRIDVVAPDQPVQSAGDVEAAAQRQYEADLAWLAGLDRVEQSRRRRRTRTARRRGRSLRGRAASPRTTPWLSINGLPPRRWRSSLATR